MEVTCRRCHETLREVDRYCPACGLPQLMYSAAEMPEAVSDGIALQPGETSAVRNGIDWPTALRTTATYAIPIAVLCSSIPPVGFLCVVAGSALAVSIYARRMRRTRLSGAAGARIGMVMGLIAGWLTMSLIGGLLWFKRYVLHQGGELDSMWQTQIEKGMNANTMISQMGGTNAQSIQAAQIYRAFVLSADGRAALAFSALLLFGGLIIVLAIIGGVVGARFLTQPRVRA